MSSFIAITFPILISLLQAENVDPVHGSPSLPTDLVKEWTPILEDQLLIWKKNGISQQLVNRTFHFYGSNIIYQHINQSIYVYDPNGYCFCNKSVYGNVPFTAHLRVCRAVESILAETVKQYQLPNFEFVWSLDDIPMWISQPPMKSLEDQEWRLQGELYPGFGATRCWSKGGLSLPFLGTHQPWHINTYERDLPNGDNYLPLAEREPKAVFRGGPKGCSFERNTQIDFQYAEAFNWTKRGCGRFLLLDIAHRYPQYINYTFQYLTHNEQERIFRYVLSVEGFGGWVDRLLTLLFGNMVVLNQEHPCDQWFEPLLMPYQHYIPVAHDFRNLPGVIAWANSHPNTVKQILQNSNRFANRYLRRNGILAYTYTLMKLYSERLTYPATIRTGVVESQYLYNNSYLSLRCSRNSLI